MKRFFATLAILIFTLTSAFSQSGRKLPSKSQKGQDDAIRLRADEVLLNITVIDPHGRQATDLTKDEFIIAEDAQRQAIESFLVSSVPVNVVMMLDASGSVAPDINSLKEAAMGFVNQLGQEDKVSVMEFHTHIELIQDWTSRGEDIRHAISWRFKPGRVMTKEGRATYGMTALYDSLYLAATEQLAKVEGRKAVILLTDGLDTSSKATYEQALAAIIKSGALVYVVSKARAIRAAYKGHPQVAAVIDRAEFLMTEIATRTGGQIFSPLKDEEMKDVYAKVARELKNQYIITYVPKNERRDGGLRSVRVYLTRAGYVARTRDSYYAPKE